MSGLVLHATLCVLGMVSILLTDIWSNNWFFGGVLLFVDLLFGVYLLILITLVLYRRRLGGGDERSAMVLSESVSEIAEGSIKRGDAEDPQEPPA